MAMELEKYMVDLEERIDPAVERENQRQWIDFLENRFEGEIFSPQRPQPSEPKTDWPDININDAIEDYDLMILDQLRLVSDTLSSGSGNRLNVRTNYGTGIIPSLFGCEQFIMPRETNTLPTARPLGSQDRLKKLLDASVPDIRRGLGEKVFDCAEHFLKAFAEYPKITEFVDLYHPDMQGPIDILELVWGSEMFLGFYDHPQLVKDMLELITRTYIVFMRGWFDLAGMGDVYSAHWGLAMKGHVMLRDDSLMNLSPESHVEFVRPFDQRILDEFGGGGIHFCGRGDHYIEAMSQMNGLSAIAMSEPEYNDMEIIYRNTVDKGIKLIGFNPQAAQSADRPLRAQVQCNPG